MQFCKRYNGNCQHINIYSSETVCRMLVLCQNNARHPVNRATTIGLCITDALFVSVAELLVILAFG